MFQEGRVATPAGIAVAITLGRELGLSPLQSIQNVAVINGRPSIYGDAIMALIHRSGELEEFSERFEGSGAEFAAVCCMKRCGHAEAKEERFSVAGARKAGLWRTPARHRQWSMDLRICEGLLRTLPR